MLTPIALALLLSLPPAENEPRPPPSSPSNVEQSIELASDTEAEALYEAGVRAFEQGNFQQALSAFDASLQVEVSPRALYSRAQTYNHLDRCELAVSDYQRVIELLPEDHPAQQATRDAVLHCARRMKDPRGTGEPSPPPRRITLQEPKPLATGDDPGRHFRRGGTASIVLGSTAAAVGLIGGIHNFRWMRHDKLLERDERQQSPTDEDAIAVLASSSKAHRRKALVWLGAGLGLGGLGITGGVLLRREGRKRSERWRNGMASWAVLPTSRGLVFNGRF